MVWKSLSDIAFNDVKQLLVGCREQLRKKDTEFNSKVSHSFKSAKWNQKKLLLFKSLKKCCLLGKSTTMSNLILCFSEIPKVLFVSTLGRWPFYLSLKKLSVWSNALFTVFAFEMCKREAYRKQTGSKVSVFLNKQGLHFRAWPIYVGFTLSHEYLQILCLIISIVD